VCGVSLNLAGMNFMIPKKYKAMLNGIYFSKDMILRINLGGETNHPITFAVAYNPMILRINLGGETNHPITFAVAYIPSNSTQVCPIILRGKSAIYIKLKVVCRWGVPVNKNGLTGDIITGMIRASNPHMGFLQFVTIDYPPAPYLQFLKINSYNCLTGPSSRDSKLMEFQDEQNPTCSSSNIVPIENNESQCLHKQIKLLMKLLKSSNRDLLQKLDNILNQCTKKATNLITEGGSEVNDGSQQQYFDQDVSRRELAHAIILHRYPLSIVDHVGFRKFVAILQPLFKMVLRNTIKNDILKIFDNLKSKTSKLLETLTCRIAITIDMNSVAYFKLIIL
ncbi:hypothetical protein H5410_045572, partial [Solanum commersonii]